MKRLDKLLQLEVTRKQFIISLLSAAFGLMGISSFVGIFTQNVETPQSTRPGYGKQNYGP